jgi:hypothetical protein
MFTNTSDFYGYCFAKNFSAGGDSLFSYMLAHWIYALYRTYHST